MSTSIERLGMPISLPIPSPSRSNPFARPNLPKAGSFTRTSLLPTFPSPVKPSATAEVDATPTGKSGDAGVTGSANRPEGKSRSAWRLLWRGGVEIGQEGYRLDGVTFFARLNFPSTPSQPISNPFDALSTPLHPSPVAVCAQSPFALPSADTDICLSLESMRGRKYLSIRGVMDLLDTDVLEGSDGDESDPSASSGVQMAISPSSPLLVAYFTGLLCRDAELGKNGRTKKAVLLALGDDDSPANTLLIYGQLQPREGSLRLMISRRRPANPPPSDNAMVKPGDPLPRAPLFFPAKKSKPLPFPNRSALAKSRSFSRTSSVSSIYAHPTAAPSVSIARAAETGPGTAAPHPQRGVGSGKTPGRRGEKRRRMESDTVADAERRRKAGKVVMVVKQEIEEVIQETSVPMEQNDSMEQGLSARSRAESGNGGEEEDIFGKRNHRLEVNPGSDAAAGASGESSTAAAAATAAKKTVRVPQQVLDNKSLIRKQAMVLMETRGYPRDHEMFKDVFAVTIKGVYFALRDALLDGALEKARVQDLVTRHLDMYLPPSSTQRAAEDEGGVGEGSDEDTAVDDEPLFPWKDRSAIQDDIVGNEWGQNERVGGGDSMEGILPVGVLGEIDDEPFSRRRSMDVVQEEDEDEDEEDV